METTQTTQTTDGQHIHVHIHLSPSEVVSIPGSKGEGVTETKKETPKATHLNSLLTIFIMVLLTAVLHKYGLVNLDNVGLNLNELKVALNPFPSSPLPPPLMPSPPTNSGGLQAVNYSPAVLTTQRCIASGVSLQLSGYSVPASDSNIAGLPKEVCHNGCVYTVVENESGVGIEGGKMRFVGRFMPVPRACNEGNLVENNGMQKASLTIIPLLYGYKSLWEYFTGGDPASEPSSEAIPHIQIPFVGKKIEEARIKVGEWVKALTKWVAIFIGGVLILIGLFTNRLSRLILIITGVTAVWYVY